MCIRDRSYRVSYVLYRTNWGINRTAKISQRFWHIPRPDWTLLTATRADLLPGCGFFSRRFYIDALHFWTYRVSYISYRKKLGIIRTARISRRIWRISRPDWTLLTATRWDLLPGCAPVAGPPFLHKWNHFMFFFQGSDLSIKHNSHLLKVSLKFIEK